MTSLASLSPQIIRPILAQSVETTFRAGTHIYSGVRHAETAFVGVVVGGLLRFYVCAPDGRAMTITYAGRGQLIRPRRLALAAGSRASEQRFGGFPLDGEVLQDTTMLLLPRDVVAAAASRNVELSWALTGEIARQAERDQAFISTNVFSPIRSRIARHLLMLASSDGQELVVRVSHQDLADAIGSVREVVSRILCRFSTDGLVRRRGRLLVLPDPAALVEASLE